ncbi:hypothetical protein CCACVL1_17257 [Corchorus capsularis]|uniref:Uncharacterized protein n=1 Tax=Corchorus capsularis TaxID=210143 RepID=A0A1R3HSR1_COCAP|nr:hypothetical protein CCACVL1_17257 [Corchorus capsularis]
MGKWKIKDRVTKISREQWSAAYVAKLAMGNLPTMRNAQESSRN